VIPTIDEPVVGQISLRTDSDYGARLTLAEFPQDAPLAGLELTLWGVPAAPNHDAERFPTGSSGCPGLADASCNTPTTSSATPTPLTENPTTCPVGPPQSATVFLTTHQDPTNPVQAQAPYLTAVNCDGLSFQPGFSAAPTTTEAGSPTGLDLELVVPQTQSATGPSPSQTRSAEFVIEDGVLLESPPPGVDVCTPAQAGIGSESPPACPQSSEVGTAAVNAALFPSPIPGRVYFGGEDIEGHLLFLLASGYGVDIKLPLFIEEDLEVGGTVVAFDSLPQLPISGIGVHLNSGANLLETVDECGTFSIQAWIEPWSAEPPAIALSTDFSLNSGPGGTACPGGPADPATTPPPPTPSVSVADPAPTVKIKAHPRPRSRSSRARFSFSSSIPNSTFRCSLDAKPFRRCTPPLRLRRLKTGRHRFRVFAVSPTGKRGKPAVYRFTVLAQRRKGRVGRRDGSR
jgi:hypothetical protein